MKRKVSNMWRSVTALLLALCLAFGNCGTAMVASAAESDDTIDYVVIGDSMTNGYCLPGYYPQNTSDDNNVRGYDVEVPGTYPVLFQEYLAETTGKDVDLHQLSISGIRAEELHFLLDPEYTGDAYTARVFDSTTDGENWFRRVFRSREDYSSVDYGNDTLRAEYVKAIAEAEVISLNVGTNNFGTFLTGELQDIVLGGEYEYDLNDVLGQITDDVEILAAVESLRGELAAIINEQVDPSMSATANQLVDMFLYAYAGFAVNYTASVEAIRTINPNAQLIIMGLMNNMDGMTLTVGEDIVYLDAMYGAVIKAANVYMAGLDVVNQVVNGSASAIYVDVKDVELIVDQIAGLDTDNYVYDAENILEWKMVSTITGNIEDYLSIPESRIDSVELDSASDIENLNPLTLTEAAYAKISAALSNNIFVNLADKDTVTDVLSNESSLSLAIKVGDTTYPSIPEGVIVKELYLGIRKAIIASAANPSMDGNAVYSLVNQGEALNAILGNITTPVATGVQNMMANSYVPGTIRDAVATALTSDAGITSFLYVYARFMVAEGMGIHPTLTGHEQIYNQLVAAWENSINTEDWLAGEVNTALEDLYKLVETYGPEVLDAAWAYAEENGYIDMVEAKAAEVKAAVEAFAAEVIPQIENAIAELEAAKAELEAQIEAEIAKLQNAAEELEAAVRAEIEAKIAELEAAKALLEEKIAELEEKLAEIEAKVNELIAAVEGLEDAVENFVGVVTGAVEGAIDEALDQVQDALDRIADAVEVAEGIVDKINSAIDEAQALVKEAEAAVEAFIEEVKETIAEIKAAAEQAVSDAKEKALELIEEAKGNLIAAAEAALEDLKDMAISAAEELLDMVSAEVEAKVNAAIDAFNEALYGATHGEYTVSKDSYYVSLGDSSVTGFGLTGYSNYGYQVKVPESFPYKLAEAIGLDVDTQFVQLGQGGLRVEDIRYILDEDYVPDEYTLKRTLDEFETYGGGIDNYRATYAEEIAKADLITIGYGNNNFTTFVTAQLGRVAENKYPYEMDWSRYVGAEGVPYVEDALAEVYAYFTEAGLDAAYADMLTLVVECYAYAYIGFAFNYTEVLNDIHEINPDALVIVVGSYNPIDEMVIDIEGEQIALGEIVDGLIDLTNVHFTAYSMLTPNTIFVAAPDVETFFDADVAAGEYKVVDTQTYLMAMYTNSGKAMHADANGHEYIKEQILNALTLNYEGLLGDANSDGIVNTRDAMLVLQYSTKTIDADALDLTVSDVNGDGAVNTRDAMLILQYSTKAIDKFPAED